MKPPSSPQLRRPSKIPASMQSRNLYEISDAENNSRASATMMPPPSSHLKHKPSGCMLTWDEHYFAMLSPSAVPEPASKRKTLAERAGEPGRDLPAPQSSLPLSAAVKATTITGVRNISNASSGSFKTFSSSSRNTSGSSFNGNYAQSTRPPSSHGAHRSQTSLAHSRTKSQPQVTATPRSTTSMDVHGGPKPVSQRQGTHSISYIPHTHDPFISPLKQRRSRAEQSGNIYNLWPRSDSSHRDLSISTAMQSLSLVGAMNASSQQDQRENTQCSTTPSHIPKLLSVGCCPTSSVANSPLKRSTFALSPKKPAPLTPFLNKSSNTPIAWDTKGRLDDMEKSFGNLMDQMESATAEKSNLQEHMNLYKRRSMSLSL